MRKNVFRTSVRLDNDLYMKALEDSNQTGKSIASILRDAYAKGGNISPTFSRDETKDFLRQLRMIGNNINQIARQINSGFRAGHSEAFQELRNDLGRLLSLVAEKNG